MPQLIARVQLTDAATSFAAKAPTSSDNNVAISIGNGTVTLAGQGSNNSATAFGARNTAAAFNGNGNRAMVVGSDSLSRASGGNQTATAIGRSVQVVRVAERAPAGAFCTVTKTQ